MTETHLAVPDPAISARRHVIRDGVALAYDEWGHGSPAAVLLHGLGDSRHVMAPLADRLRDRHRVVTVDLRGHGDSAAPEGDYAVGTLADDIAYVCDHLDIASAVIVGHSLGGAVAMQLAAHAPDKVAAVVLLDGALLFPEELAQAAQPMLDALRTAEWRDVVHGFVDTGFIASDDPRLRQRAHAEIERLTQHAVVGTWEAAGSWDAEPAIRACRVPVLYVESGMGLCNLDGFAALCPQLVVGRTVGLGHNQMLATPDQAAAMIDRFVAVHVAVD
ncbi:MAG TPA: alpha/beta hydrolase [Euzebyales bacterium]|nr:alpha/beta hydrolase [Euzebyales bacterium]